MATMIIRIFKSYLSRENKTWTNTYEVANANIPDSNGFAVLDNQTINVDQAMSAINQLVGFEKAIHLPAIQFIHATASTWAPDSDPYNPFNLLTVGLAGAGERPESVAGVLDNVDLRNVLKIERRGQTGKAGALAYRGCLEKADVQNAGGRWELTAASTMEADIDLAKEAIEDLLTATQPEQARMVMIGGTLVKTVVPHVEAGEDITKIKRTYIAPYHVRKVVSIVYHGIGVRKQDNKSFDRPA